MINIGSSFEANGVSIVSGNRITFANAGTYNIQYSIQFSNSDANSDNVDVWLRKNGTDVAESNSVYNVPGTAHGGAGNLIAAINYVLTVAAGDYLQLAWAVSATTISIETISAQTGPTVPATPGVIVTAQQVMYTQSGYSGISGWSGFSGISGWSGTSGYSGSGVSGYSGYSGSGVSGWSGFSGYSGQNGAQGASGTSGTSGYSGFSGSGVSGYSGFSGYSGSGVSGYSGFSGYSGAAGVVVYNVFVPNLLVTTTSQAISSGYSASSVGPITVSTGTTVTIPSGSRWAIQ